MYHSDETLLSFSPQNVALMTTCLGAFSFFWPIDWAEMHIFHQWSRERLVFFFSRFSAPIWVENICADNKWPKQKVNKANNWNKAPAICETMRRTVIVWLRSPLPKRSFFVVVAVCFVSESEAVDKVAKEWAHSAAATVWRDTVCKVHVFLMIVLCFGFFYSRFVWLSHEVDDFLRFHSFRICIQRSSHIAATVAAAAAAVAFASIWPTALILICFIFFGCNWWSSFFSRRSVFTSSWFSFFFTRFGGARSRTAWNDTRTQNVKKRKPRRSSRRRATKTIKRRKNVLKTEITVRNSLSWRESERETETESKWFVWV